MNDTTLDVLNPPQSSVTATEGVPIKNSLQANLLLWNRIEKLLREKSSPAYPMSAKMIAQNPDVIMAARKNVATEVPSVVNQMHKKGWLARPSTGQYYWVLGATNPDERAPAQRSSKEVPAFLAKAKPAPIQARLDAATPAKQDMPAFSLTIPANAPTGKRLVINDTGIEMTLVLNPGATVRFDPL